MATRAYLRGSTSMQKETCGVQLELINAYCNSHGLSEPIVYQDKATSGGKFVREREAGGILLKQLLPGDNLVIAKLDRMFRKLKDCVIVLEDFRRHKINLHVVNFHGSSMNLSTDMGKFVAHLLALIAELERDMLCERTRDVIRSMRKRGFAVGRPNWGYMHKTVPGTNSRGGPRKMQVPDPEERVVMARLAGMRATRMSWQAIYEQIWYAERLCTRDGTPWTIKRIRTAVRAELLLQLSEIRRCDEASH